MPALYLTLIATLLAGLGARDQGTVAGLVAKQGQRPAVLLVALLSVWGASALAAYAAYSMLQTLPPPARSVLAALALALAGLESIVVPSRKAPKEPTNSLGALALVLIAQNVSDAARFVVFGLGVGLGSPWMAGLAGAASGSALATAVWLEPQWLERAWVAWLRRTAGLCLVFAACVMGFREWGIL